MEANPKPKRKCMLGKNTDPNVFKEESTHKFSPNRGRLTEK
jgi:hypothetical protein